MRSQVRFRIALSAVILCLALACVLPAFSFAGGPELVRVATLPGGFSPYAPCSDGNHNGRYEAYGTWGGVSMNLLICEDTGGNSFRCDSVGLNVGWICDVGAGNSDSLCDLLCHPSNWLLQDWEAPALDSFPSQLVWEDTPPWSVYSAQFCDLDRDGRKEIVFCGFNGDGIYVYENQGDNHYVEVPFPRRVGTLDIMCMFAVGDFDLDGHTELVGGNENGDLLLYECLGNDQYARVCSLNYEHDNENEDYYHAAANNMDGDGLPKLISLFRRMPSGGCIRIFEEPVHNQLICVCSLTCAYDPFHAGFVAAGDVDGDGGDEFAVSTGIDVLLFKSTGIDQYARTWQLDWPAIRSMRLFDINRDGRDELIISCTDSTCIFEDTSGLVGVSEFTRLPQLHSVNVQPTIVRFGASVVFSGVPPGSDIEVLSLDGRLVSRTSGLRQPTWTWNLRSQSGNLVPAGTYFAVIRSKGKSTSLKLCLVR